MAITLYGISNCDTVKKARAWLAEHGVEYAFHDFRKAGVPADHLDAWVRAAGWEKLLNRQGTTWRKLDPATQSLAVDAVAGRRRSRRACPDAGAAQRDQAAGRRVGGSARHRGLRSRGLGPHAVIRGSACRAHARPHIAPSTAATSACVQARA